MQLRISQMSSLLFVSTGDFTLANGGKGPILCHSIPGFSLMLFYSPHCQFCSEFIRVFRDLPGTVGGCQFGILNVSTNRKLVEMSQNTITPIKYVPYVILYIDGKPFMEYKGPRQIGEIQRFVMDVAENIKQKQSFVSQVNKNAARNGSKQAPIPQYTVGRPVKGDDEVCYLQFQTAYPGKRK